MFARIAFVALPKNRACNLLQTFGQALLHARTERTRHSTHVTSRWLAFVQHTARESQFLYHPFSPFSARVYGSMTKAIPTGPSIGRERPTFHSGQYAWRPVSEPALSIDRVYGSLSYHTHSAKGISSPALNLKNSARLADPPSWQIPPR